MSEPIIITLAITAAVVIIAAVVVLCVIVYHQMLLFNEVNKRLLVMSIEDQEKYEGSLQRLAQAELELQQAADSMSAITNPKGPLDDADEEIHDLGIE